MASVRTAGLTKDFGDLRAVNGHTLHLPEGGSVCLPSGIPTPIPGSPPKGQP